MVWVELLQPFKGKQPGDKIFVRRHHEKELIEKGIAKKVIVWDPDGFYTSAYIPPDQTEQCKDDDIYLDEECQIAFGPKKYSGKGFRKKGVRDE